jgi:indolepyruvate ferredoxin oxidoreductase beta subunit
MKCDVILAGVGGQGVLSIAAIIAQAAMNEGLTVRQSEVHGMAQRGGAVLAHLRISDTGIASDLVPKGGADLIVSMEPLESLRYTEWLSPRGMVISAMEPFVNIGNYPNHGDVIAALNGFPRKRIIKAEALAKEAGQAKSVNMVMVGAASPFLPVRNVSLENAINAMFGKKRPGLAEANVRAFQLGRKASVNQPDAALKE